MPAEPVYVTLPLELIYVLYPAEDSVLECVMPLGIDPPVKTKAFVTDKLNMINALSAV